MTDAGIGMPRKMSGMNEKDTSRIRNEYIKRT